MGSCGTTKALSGDCGVAVSSCGVEQGNPISTPRSAHGLALAYREALAVIRIFPETRRQTDNRFLLLYPQTNVTTAAPACDVHLRKRQFFHLLG